jgi:hypothetical protein
VAPKPEVRQTRVASEQVRVLPLSQQGSPTWPQALQAVPLSTAVHAKPVLQVPPAPPQQAWFAPPQISQVPSLQPAPGSVQV